MRAHVVSLLRMPSFLWGALPCFLLLGFVTGLWSQPIMERVRGEQVACEEKYSLLNPWLRCAEQEEELKKREFGGFRDSLLYFIDRLTSGEDARVTHVSIYFRDLEDGPWFGIGEKEFFSPASLFKVPILLAYLKEAGTYPDLLGRRVEIRDVPMDPLQEMPVGETLEEGQSYTVEELLRRMIVYSDNRSKDVLKWFARQYLYPEDITQHALSELGLLGEDPLSQDMTVKQYASLFRVLYNASYLTREMSQRALELLSHVEYRKGIVAGVPPGVVVAHKFGERAKSPTEKQLHDCGIVYYPEDHYLLCVMTRGRDFTDLAPVIQEISRMVYEEVTARHKGSVSPNPSSPN